MPLTTHTSYHPVLLEFLSQWQTANAVLPQPLALKNGTLAESQLVERLKLTDAAVIMKVGRNLEKVRRAVETAGLLARAVYVERGTMADQKVMRLVDKTDDEAPYFSMILIHGDGRRP